MLVPRFSFLVSRFSILVSRFSFLVSRFSHLCVELYHCDSLIHNAKDRGEEHEEEKEDVDNIPNRPKVTPLRERNREERKIRHSTVRQYSETIQW